MMLECAKIFSFIKMITCYLSLSSLMGSIAICWSTSVKLPPEILRGSQLDHAEWWLLMCSQILFSTVFLGFSTNVHYRDGLLSFFSVIVTYIHLSLVSGRLNNTVLNDDWIIKEIMKKNWNLEILETSENENTSKTSQKMQGRFIINESTNIILPMNELKDW